MDQSENKPNLPPVAPKWSELCPDLLRCVFERLSFTNLKRAKSVCRSWNYASRSCVPKRNQIPWLILFPPEQETDRNNNSCALFVPDDRDNLYKTRDLGVGFTRSSCLATYGSWLLMFDRLWSLYILNPLTLERIDLPNSQSIFPETSKPDLSRHNLACLWIDETTRDYLVVWITHLTMVFTKKGDDTWRNVANIPHIDYAQIVYNRKDHKAYTYDGCRMVLVWDFSSDIPSLCDRKFVSWNPNHDQTYWRRSLISTTQIATTASGQVLHVHWINSYTSKALQFRIKKADRLMQSWVEIDSLGDEALILDLGFTVVAQNVPGIKRNSVYFSDLHHDRNDPNRVFVYDLTTRIIERLPQFVFSSIRFPPARWFLPGFAG